MRSISLLFFLVIFCCLQKDSNGVKHCLKKVIDAVEKSFVCVCRPGYCDEVEPLGDLRRNQIAVYASSIDGKRFNRTDAFFQTTKDDNVDNELTLNTYRKYQKIIGFGAAFTDSSGLNLLNLTEDQQKALIGSYYSSSGIELNMGRVPIGCTDFSIREYSYCDTKDDFEFKSFKLANEDYQMKIPFIKMAKEFTNNNLKLFTGSWSPPAWMKETDKLISGGKLKGTMEEKYYAAYPNYYIKFFEEYNKEGIQFWGMGVQNEPSLGIIDSYWWPELYFSADMEREFVKHLLGPAIRANPVTKDLKIMVNDDQRFELPHRPNEILNDTAAAKFVDGIAVHWYEDFLFSSDVLTQLHNQHPDKFILATEACNGYMPFKPGPNLGNWDNGMTYAADIIDDLQHWVSGWTDWNIALDLKGGPTFVKNYVDASILINATANEFYKQPSYYTLGHFSKFLKTDSVRIDLNFSKYDKKSLDGVAFVRPDDNIVIVLMNRDSKSYTIRVKDPIRPLNSALITIDANSVYTLIWKK